MKLPSKVTPYKKSTLSSLPIILKTLSTVDLSPELLYSKVKKDFASIAQFIDALDCLFALGKIELLPEGVVHYVE